MPLDLLDPADPLTFLVLALPVIGVAVIVLAVWLTGGWRDAHLGEAADVFGRLAEDEPDFAPGEVLIDGAGRAALVQARSGRAMALVFPVGANFVARLLDPAEIRVIGLDGRLAGATEIVLVTADFARPIFRFFLPPDHAAKWMKRLYDFQAQAIEAPALAARTRAA